MQTNHSNIQEKKLQRIAKLDKKVKHVVTRKKNTATRPDKYTLDKCLLEDGALKRLKNTAHIIGTKTNNNYITVTKSVTTHIMPKEALQKKKIYMCRFLKKPLDMKVKDFVERVISMNKLLTIFPDVSPTIPEKKIPDKKILDLLESAMLIYVPTWFWPNVWNHGGASQLL